MDISLAPNIERLLRNKIAEGIYDSLSEAVNATLTIALNNTYAPQNEIDKLNQEIQKGVDDAQAGKMTDALEFLDKLKREYE